VRDSTDMGDFLCSCCMMHKIWWAVKIIPCQCCYRSARAPPSPPPSHSVKMTPPGQLGARITVTLHSNDGDMSFGISEYETVGQAKLRLFEEYPLLPPPAAQRLHFGGIEFRDGDTFEQLGVTEGAVFKLSYEPGIHVDFHYTNKHGSTSSRTITLWREEVLLNAIAHALRREGMSEGSVARAVSDEHHHWYHRPAEERGDGNQDSELCLSTTGVDAGVQEGDAVAVIYGERQEELISTDEIAGCWCCVCTPYMCTSCFRKEADGPNGLVHKGCLIFPLPFPFNESRRRQGQTNKFAKHDDETNVDHYTSSCFVCNGTSFSVRLGP